MTMPSSDWRVAKSCNSSACLGVRGDGQSIELTSTTHPGSPILRLSREEFAVFLAGVKDGDFDDLVSDGA